MGACSPPGLRARARWEVSWASASNGRPYEWQRPVLSEPRRDWPGVVPKFRVTRPTFRLNVLGNLPFHLPVLSSSFILRTRFACHLVAACAAPPSPSERVGEPLLHAPVALVPRTCCCSCCASPRRAASRRHLGLHSSL